MLENEGHNPLIQHQTEESSAGMSSGSHYPSHAKHDEGLAHHHTSGGEIEDMPPLVAVSLPADSGTLLVHGTPKPSDVKTNTEEDQCVEDQQEGSSTVEPITWGNINKPPPPFTNGNKSPCLLHPTPTTCTAPALCARSQWVPRIPPRS